MLGIRRLAVLAAALGAAAPAYADMTVVEPANIKPMEVQSLCLDVTTGSVLLARCSGSDEQKVSMERRTNAGLTLVVKGRCIQSNAAGELLTLAACNNTARQVWTPFNAGQIRTGAGLCMDAAGNKLVERTPVIGYACHGGQNQNWVRTKPQRPTPPDRKLKVGTTIYPSHARGKCLTAGLGYRLHIETCDGRSTQRFTLEVGVRNREVHVNGRCLTMPPRNGMQIETKLCSQSDPAQKWFFRGGSTFESGGACMDVAGAGAADGTPVIRFSCHHRSNQRFDHTG